MEKLKLGKITTKELASQYGIAYSTFRKNAKKKLEELEYYCNFIPYHGGVEITEIYLESYVKGLLSKDSEVYLQLVMESKTKLCSISGMARKLQKLYPDTYGEQSYESIRKRLTKAGKNLFGETNYPVYRTDKQEIRYSGPKGYREYCQAIKLSDYNEYRFLTEEENKIFDDLIDSYNVKKQDIVNVEQQQRKLRKQIGNHEITLEEFMLLTENLELFPNILSRFKAATGKTLVRATYHDVLESAFYAEARVKDPD